jgi:nitrous oxidase accessory protein
MFFYIPVTDFSGLETLPHTIRNNGDASLVSFANNDKVNGAVPATVDITNLPPAILAAYPGLDNAVPNDNQDDSDTIQAVLSWLNAQPASNSNQVSTIYIPEGVFDLSETVKVSTANITLKGAGAGRTILQNTSSFKARTQELSDEETVFNSIDQNAYLFTLKKAAKNVSFMDMTLRGSTLHGAIFSGRNEGLVISNLEFNDFLWSAVRLFEVTDASIHDNVFIDAGGQANGGNGITGGSIFATYLKNSEIYNNSITKSGQREGNVYGIKGRGARNIRIYNNTINTNFAIELPFENDSFVEIDHNYLNGVISVPKFGGGKVPEDGFTFHIHHNYFTESYSLEWARNGAEVNHNVFVFETDQDTGNLLSNFGSKAAKGPTKLYNNLIVNPGRGIAWHKGIYNNFSFYNNEVIANQTETPRTAGLFGFNRKTDFSTIEIRDNLIRVNGISRPLMRNQESYGAVIENNELINIADVDDFKNPDTGAPRGLIEPLSFAVGVDGEFIVNGAELSAIANSTNTAETAENGFWARWSPAKLLAHWSKLVEQALKS